MYSRSQIDDVNTVAGALSRIIVGPWLAVNRGVLPSQTSSSIQSNTDVVKAAQ